MQGILNFSIIIIILTDKTFKSFAHETVILSSGKPNLVCVDVNVPVGLGMDSHDGLARQPAWVTRWTC
jgi:hypothetical protein